MNDLTAVDNNVKHTPNQESIAVALGRMASGVYVLTVQDGSVSDGLLCSFVQQVSFTPAKIMVSIASNRQVLDTIKSTKCFCLNILANNSGPILKAFAKPSLNSKERFDQIKYYLPENKSNKFFGPVLEDALSAINLTFDGVYDALDHQVVFGICESAVILNPHFEPMIHLRPDGYKY